MGEDLHKPVNNSKRFSYGDVRVTTTSSPDAISVARWHAVRGRSQALAGTVYSLLAEVPTTVRSLEIATSGIEGWSIRPATISIPARAPGFWPIAYRPVINRRWRRRRRYHVDLSRCERTAYDGANTQTQQTRAYGIAIACACRRR